MEEAEEAVTKKRMLMTNSYSSAKLESSSQA
jgi:hypothetical protein